MRIEYWKPVVGFEGLYEVSSRGRVRSVDKTVSNGRGSFVRKGMILKQYPSGVKEEYLSVSLSKNGHPSRFLVHRLVATAFIPNPLNLPCVNHKIEFEKTNNTVENLEWCDQKYNVNYGTLLERRSNMFSKQVYQYNLDGNLINTWKSLKEIHIVLGFSQGLISEVCNGHRKRAYGFVWAYS